MHFSAYLLPVPAPKQTNSALGQRPKRGIRMTNLVATPARAAFWAFSARYARLRVLLTPVQLTWKAGKGLSIPPINRFTKPERRAKGPPGTVSAKNSAKGLSAKRGILGT